MKKSFTWATQAMICVATGLAMLWASPASAATSGKNEPKEATARVISVTGSARYSTGGNVWQQLKKGDVLKAGAVIQTAGGNSTVDLLFGEVDIQVPEPKVGELLYYRRAMPEPANVVRIKSDSILAIDKLTVMQTGADEVSETQLDLRAGQIMGNVKKLSAASKYEIKFPNGVAGIRGTIFAITAQGVVYVGFGSVVIAYVGPDGTVVTQVVMGGQRFDPATGQVTPISDLTLRELIQEIRRIVIIAVSPISYPYGPTVIFVSPTTGHNSSSSSGSSPPPQNGD